MKNKFKLFISFIFIISMVCSVLTHASEPKTYFKEEDLIEKVKEAEIYATFIIQPEVRVLRSPVTAFINNELFNTRPDDYFVDGKGYRLMGGLSRPAAYRTFMEQFFTDELIDSWLGRGTIFDEETDTVYWYPVSGPQEGYNIGTAKYTMTESTSKKAVCHMDLTYDYYHINTSFDYIYENYNGKWVFTQFATRFDLICQIMEDRESANNSIGENIVKSSSFYSALPAGIVAVLAAIIAYLSKQKYKRLKNTYSIIGVMLSVMILSLALSGCGAFIAVDKSETAKLDPVESESPTAFFNPTAEPAHTFKPVNESEWEYEEVQDPKFPGIKLLKYTGSSNAVTIPSELNGSKVISLGESLFEPDKIPGGISSVFFEGSYAPYNGSLKNIESIDEIIFGRGFLDLNLLFDTKADESFSRVKKVVIKNCGTLYKNSFSQFNGIKEISFDETLTAVSAGFFADWKDLEKISIPGVKIIEDNTFSGCTSLQSIDLSSVVSIGRKAFSKCSSLKSIHLGKELTAIGSYAFSGCTGLEKIKYESTVAFFPEPIFDDLLSLSEAEFGDQINMIPEKLFIGAGIKGNLSITGTALSVIGDRAFEGNTYMTGIVLPESISSIGNYAFNYCASLTDIKMPLSLTELKDGVFMNCCSLTVFTLPDTVTSVGEYLLCNCDRLKTVTLPETFTEIPAGMFYGCADLSSFDHICIGVGDKAFALCTSLKEINTGDAAVYGADVFKWCFSK
jgi:hypothetical protein